MNEISIRPELVLHFIPQTHKKKFVDDVLSFYDHSETGCGYLDIYHLAMVMDSYIIAAVGDDSLLTENLQRANEVEAEYTGHLQSDILTVLNHFHYFTADVDENDYPGYKLSGNLYNVPIKEVW